MNSPGIGSAGASNATLPRAVHSTFSEFDAVVDGIPDYDGEYLQLDSGSVRTAMTRVSLDRLISLRFHEDAPSYLFRAAAPQGAVSAIFVAPGTEGTVWRGSPADERLLMVYGPGAEHVGRSRGLLTSFSLHVAEDAIAQHAGHLGYELEWGPESARALSLEPPALDGLRDATEQLFGVAETATELLEFPEVRRVQEETILTALVQAAATGAARADQSTRSQQRAARLAVEVLEARADEPVYLSELCAAASVSERTLRSAFQRLYGVSPIRFLHLHRMKQVRRALLVADPATDRVSDIAARFGFANLGRFAVEFRELFGLSPSKLLRSPR